MPDTPPTPPPKTGPKLEKVREVRFAAPVLALDPSPDGTAVAVACQDGLVALVPLADGEAGASQSLGRHSSYASSVRWLPGRNRIVSGGYDGVLLWHDLETRQVERQVRAHEFWCWDLAVSRDGRWLASVTGRYDAGGYRYEPAPEREPSVRVWDAVTGLERHRFPHVPPTQAVAWTPDGRHVAAGNLMGEVRVWDVETGSEVSRWKDDGLTSWGVIKSHHFLGGIFAMEFSPDGAELYVCGMGPMVDPMAGNGVQRWQRFDWRTGKRLDQTHDGESGQGLMEALAFHPSGTVFAMAGRLFQGTWNLALFETATGRNLLGVDAKHRITGIRFSADGSRLFVSKARGQEKPKGGVWTESGLLEVHSVSL